MPQMSMDCLGLLSLTASIGSTINEILARQYRSNSRPVAFVDESFETNFSSTFYVIAVAVVENDELHSSREELSRFYSGRALHAAPMFANLERETLRQATQLVARQNDGLDIVVCAPLEAGTTRDAARNACLSFAAAKVHREFETRLFVLDSLGTPTENRLDQRTFRDLRSAEAACVSRDTIAVHCRPSEEILLGIPDVLAWAYRQEHVRRDRT